MCISTKLYSYTSESIPAMFRNSFSDHLMSIPLHWKQPKWFAINEISTVSPVQDTIHLGVSQINVTFTGFATWKVFSPVCSLIFVGVHFSQRTT